MFDQLKGSMGRCIVEHMVKFLKHSPLSLAPDFQLIENDEAAKQSSELCQHNAGLTQAINELEELKGDPGPGSPEQASQVQQADAHNAAVAYL